MMEKVKKAPVRIPGSSNGLNGQHHTERLAVKKTYKMYVNGNFIRSESGRYSKLLNEQGELVADFCRASKKDFRDAVVTARKAQESWAKKTAYNKGQIIYRIAETLEGRKSQFVDTLKSEGASRADAEKEVNTAIDRLIYYAGWTDKYIQLFSSVNPVSSSHFNFSFPEPTGVVSVIAPPDKGLLGLITSMIPLITGGNSVIILAAEKHPLTATELAEVLHASDLPGGVVNLLTGLRKELIGPFSNHMDVNGVSYWGAIETELSTIKTNAALNVKRVHPYEFNQPFGSELHSPYLIMDFQEIKTTWHPVGL